jgi:hypothetical protein
VTAVPKKQIDVSDSIRATTLTLLKLWHEREEALGRTTFRRERERNISLVVPEERVRGADQLAQAKKARPEYWSNPEEITARGRETRPEARSRAPGGRATVSVIVDKALAEEARELEMAKAAGVSCIGKAMRRLAIYRSESYLAAEMWAAGHSFGKIASNLKCSKNLAHQHFEAAVSALCMALLYSPSVAAILLANEM